MSGLSFVSAAQAPPIPSPQQACNWTPKQPRPVQIAKDRKSNWHAQFGAVSSPRSNSTVRRHKSSVSQRAARRRADGLREPGAAST